MQKIYFFSFFTLVCISCSPRINYLGSSSEPTSRVDVFVHESAIKKNYDIMGKGYVHYGIQHKRTIEKIQSKSIEKAREKGADAILIEDYYLPGSATTISTTISKDSIFNGIRTQKNSDLQSTGNMGYAIYFLKYNQK